MDILYADDSGNTGTDYDNVQQPLFSLAGVIVETKKWFEIDKFILTRKNEIIPEFPGYEIHATEIFNGKKNKMKGYDFRKNSLKANLSLLEQLVDVIVEIKLPILMFAVIKRNLKSYCQKKYFMGIKIDPYFIAFSYLSLSFNYFLKNKERKGMIFLDEQMALVDGIEDLLERLRLRKSYDSDICIDCIIERALFVESSKSNFIQIADVCNFYINRYHSMKLGVIPSEIKKDHIEKMYRRIEPLIIKPIANPEELKEMLIFFEENHELLGKK